MASETDFGFRRVPEAAKAPLVRAVFDSVAERYDLMNDLMSAGIHRLWKDEMVAWLNPRPGQRMLDVAGGTGDVARRALPRVGPEAAKAPLVRAVFDSVAERYDLMNDLMSAGIHRLWKDEMVAWLNPRPGQRMLDVAGGTGDVARRALPLVQPAMGGVAVVCDINPGMLEIGRARAIDDGILDGIEFLCGNAEALPFVDRSFDLYTIAFGLRNVTRIERALAEARRVLRPGGRFLCLEFTPAVIPVLQPLYDLYSFAFLPLLGRLVTGDRHAYAYLVESIRRFPPQSEVSAMIAATGLERPRFRNLTGGIAALHSAWRL
jgi:demethylmenaquinone methyltransferase / 2-methoxy-6-polyprenyl-1,4-benzoquinol methylase